jgi:hypothetical protein
MNFLEALDSRINILVLYLRGYLDQLRFALLS